jgi:predicted nucleic acid-binding protein
LGQVILDSGAVLGVAHRSTRAIAAIREALERDDDITVSAPVIAETVRGERPDPRVDRVLKSVRQVGASPRQGRVAGKLLTFVDGPSTVDALIMAAALLTGGPTTILTSDVGDLRALLEAAGALRSLRSSAARVAIVAV